MNINTLKKVHCIGIGGVGVSALARYFNTQGIKVSGSNITDNNLDALRELGIDIFVGHAKENLADGVDLLVYSSAVSMDNSEIVEAKKRKIDIINYTEALGFVIANYYGIAVSGTNGKTTVTAILGVILVNAKKSPNVILGGKVSDWNGNFKAGSGDIFLVEGCEYKKNMLNLNPRAIVLTNIEEDHLDCYEGIAEIIDTFSEYVCKLKKEDVLVFNIDDKNVIKSCIDSSASKISYGLNKLADLYAENINICNGFQEFDIVWKKENLGKIKTRLPGLFNIYNILAATSMALYLGVSIDSIRTSMVSFCGISRRFEVSTLEDNKIIISDYAHHPTSIKDTIHATKEMYVGKKNLVIFQPHQKDRTIKLFNGFVHAFDEADEVILSEVYDVVGRDISEEISSRDIVNKIKQINPNSKISFAKDILETKRLVEDKKKDFGVILVMGAGDIYKIVDDLVSQ